MTDQFRYIKLGKAGDRESDCIENGRCFIGFGSGEENNFTHCIEASRDKNSQLWDALRKEFESNHMDPGSRQSKQAASSATNQLRYFFEADETTIWITFHSGKLYWARLNTELPPIRADGGSYRSTLKSWSSMDGYGQEMICESLAGSLTKLQMYRGTSCDLDLSSRNYIKRRLNGEQQPHIKIIQNAKKQLKKGVQEAIKTLTPNDFELLTELIFSKSLRRISSTGKVQKFVDIVFENPLALSGGDDRKICVQVKSHTSIQELEDYLNDDAISTYSSFYYVYHSSDDLTSDYLSKSTHNDENIILLGVEGISQLAIDSGLLNWIVDKSD